MPHIPPKLYLLFGVTSWKTGANNVKYVIKILLFSFTVLYTRLHMWECCKDIIKKKCQNFQLSPLAFLIAQL